MMPESFSNLNGVILPNKRLPGRRPVKYLRAGLFFGKHCNNSVTLRRDVGQAVFGRGVTDAHATVRNVDRPRPPKRNGSPGAAVSKCGL